MVVIILYQGGGGSGLGLWISQEIVKLHGSRILVHSNGEGCGTRFVSDSFFILSSV
jgi:signal transduction histidine kinase